jgi:hypothetical protein
MRGVKAVTQETCEKKEVQDTSCQESVGVSQYPFPIPQEWGQGVDKTELGFPGF